jgi:uncharacterized protein (TIGR03067 family)
MRSTLLTTAFVGLSALAVWLPDQRLNGDERQTRILRRDYEEQLLDFFRRLTLSDADEERLGKIIGQLDSVRFKDREKASAALIAEGPHALPRLRKALSGAPLETRMRLQHCMKTMTPPLWDQTIAKKAELLKSYPSARATNTLLNFVPLAPDDAVDAVLDALCEVGVQSGKVDAALLAALGDPLPGKRAAAAIVVGAYGTADQRKLVRKLLTDPAAPVRLRAAQGLLAVDEPDAVPVLIELLAPAELSVAERAEELLLAVAKTGAPQETLGQHGAKKCHTAWLAWWKENRDRLDTVRVSLQVLERVSGLPALQGTWRLIQENDSGQAIPCDPNERFIFKGGNLLNMVGRKATDEFNVRIIRGHRPQQMDLIPLKEPNRGVPFPAIYKIEGDKLTICVNFQPGGKRPDSFNNNANNRWIVLTMQRV